MTEVTIKTNNQPRQLLFTCEFSGAERTKLRKQFDWMSDEQFESDCRFFKYSGRYYHFNEFLTNTNPDGIFKGWHAICSDSHFSGVLIKLRGNDVIVGRYYC
jgi:hypothetical protein